jgi:hypothetical protein
MMKKVFGLLVLLSLLAGFLAACGGTPVATEPPPTQTPWIVVVTSTTGAGEVVQAQPTQTVPVVAATPTRGKQATPTPKQAATQAPAGTPESTTATVEPTETQAAATAAPPTATTLPEPADFRYPPPVLLDPPNNRPVSWKSTVLLKWSSVGELADDEYYHLHLERRPKTEAEQWYGDYVYTKDTEFLVEGAFLAPFHLPADQGYGIVYWWVRVVRQTGTDSGGKPLGVDVSSFSEERTFITEPKPE